MYDIIVVGAGTAGMSAAIYGVRAGKRVLMIEAESYGGQIINTPEIENYPGIKQTSGFEFAQGLYEQAENLGAEYKSGKVTAIEDNGSIKVVVTDDGSRLEAKAVILATGAKNRPLGIAREQELVGAGVSYCATCDGMFYRKKDVAVNGGGNTALEDAEFLSNVCNKVYLIHRRDQFRGDAVEVEKLRAKENVEFVLDSTIVELKGDDRLSSVVVENKNTKEHREIPVSGLFVAIGQVPENAVFANLISVDQTGYIVAGEDCKTNVEGIFTAGDCRTKTVRQLTTAASDGAVAALAASEYINHLA